MFKNYFKIGWRNLLKNKTSSYINIGGLAVGIAVTMLIGLWIWDEINFNSYFSNHEKIAQVMVTQTMQNESETDESVAMPVGDALRRNYSDDVKATSFVSGDGKHDISTGEKILPGSGIWVQDDFADMFTLHMLQGNRDALKDPSQIMLSESMAKALFGNEDAVNKVVRVDNRLDMKVGGVFEDMPHNTIFYDTKLLLPWSNNENNLNKQTAWNNHSARLFVQLNEHADVNKTSAKIKNVPTSHITGWKEEILLHPLDKVHLYTEFKNGITSGGRIQFVWLFGIIGLFVLLLACINFMNLSTARSEKRAKEVGIRKTVGSLRSQLISQFLAESVLTALIAFVFAIVLVQLSLPFFNSLADKQMSISWSNPLFWLCTLGFTIFTGIISGSYPAFYLSKFQPVKVLKGTFKAGRQTSIARKTLVVLQFTISVILVMGTIIVYRQIQFAKNRPVGYSRHGLITVPLTSGFFGHYDAVRNDLLQTGSVENMAESSFAPTYFYNNNSIEWRGKDPHSEVFFRDVNVTFDFGRTIGWQIKKGRDFSKEFATDSSAAILNETGAKATGLKNPVGETIKYNGKPYTIIGVVKDMVTQSPYDPLQPSVFFCSGWMGTITIRIKSTTNVRTSLANIETVFKKYEPELPFEYKFVSDEYATKFSNEERIGNLSNIFAILAIFISCLGLFGLASFVAEQRTKEIGVRKILGASVFSVWRLLSKEFAILVFISILIAAPIAYYFMHGWLQNYDYRATISWWLFAAAGIGALLITLATISFQAIKAAVANPVKSLRSE